MQDDDRRPPLDDDSAQRPDGAGAREEQTPLVRMLANPRRIRRA
ncbi:hypothetical protein [Modestobacter versicolor]